MTTLRNSAHLIGRLGMDTKTIEFDNGKMKAAFSLATSDYITKTARASAYRKPNGTTLWPGAK